MKPTQVHGIYLIKDQHLQGMIDWLVKDPEVWDRLCGWWASDQFRAVSKRNWQNQMRKESVHYYSTNGHVRKT
jgi:hypothetical protein